VRNYTFAGVGVATLSVGTGIQGKGLFVTPACKTCLKNRQDGRVVPVCPECRAVYGLDQPLATVRPNLSTRAKEPAMDSPETAAATGYPFGRSIANFMGRLIFSAAILLVMVFLFITVAIIGGSTAQEKFLSILNFFPLVLPLWVLAGLIPSLTDWKGKPFIALLTAFAPPVFLICLIVSTNR
jgi:hypothetical protein